MAKKKSGTSKNTGGDNFTVSISGNSNTGTVGKGNIATAGNGNVTAVGKGARATVNQGNLNSELAEWRKEMELKINALKDLPAEDKSTLNQQVEQIALEAKKGPQADPSRIERLFNTISAMAPDIFDVAVTTLTNPLAGIGLVIKKIGEKAQVQKG